MKTFLSLVRKKPCVDKGRRKKGDMLSEYYLFSEEGSQEDCQAWLIGIHGGCLKSVPNISPKNNRQSDGSVFKTYSTTKDPNENLYSIARSFQDLAPRGVEVVPEKVFRDVNEDRQVFLSKDILPESFEYYLFITHYFKNGARVFPIVYNSIEGVCHNVSHLFPKLIPEDDLGLLVADFQNVDKVLSLPALKPGRVVEFLAHVHLCPYCLNVINEKTTGLLPWYRLHMHTRAIAAGTPLKTVPRTVHTDTNPYAELKKKSDFTN